MNILYLSEDYIGTMVHHNLCNKIMVNHGEDVNKIILYCYSRSLNTHIDNRDKFVATPVYEPCVQAFSGNRKLYKYDFFYKIRNKFSNLKSVVDLSAIDVVHASTLFSEGALAYRLYKKYGIPYTVGVRGTDINYYLLKQPHLLLLGYKILKNASKIIYISSPIKEKVENHWAYRLFNNTFKGNGIVQPNGIDPYWHEHPREKQKINTRNRLLYIGRFDNNKNVESLMAAVLLLKNSIPNIHLTMIGGSASRHDEVISLCNKYPEVFSYLGKIYDKDKLSAEMRKTDAFVMVSHSETFGLVYVEALSQGLPIVYTKGEGIDGFFKIPVGEGVNSHDVADIARGIEKLLSNYSQYEGIGDLLNNFSWDTISDKYISFLKSAVNESQKNH